MLLSPGREMIKRSVFSLGVMVLCFIETVSGQVKSLENVSIFLPEEMASVHELIPFNVSSYELSEKEYFIFDASPHMYVIDEEGIPLYYKLVDGGVRNFLPLTDSTYAYYSNHPVKYVRLDSQLRIIDTIQLEGGYAVDFHHIEQLDNGNLILLGKDPRLVDMSQVVEGGKENATVQGAIIQELDAAMNVIYEWKSLDHISVTDAAPCMVSLHSQVIDYIHINSVHSDSDTTWIVSARNMNQVLRIHKATGEAIWRLGGIGNEFQFLDDPDGFSAQHSVYLSPSGKLSMFDNGNCKPILESRGLVYSINTIAKTVEIEYEFNHDPAIFSRVMGNFWNPGNGESIVGWGKGTSNLLLSLFYGADPILDITFPVGDPAYSYAVRPLNWDSPVISFDTDTIDFGSIELGDSARINLQVINHMDIPVQLVGSQQISPHFMFDHNLPIEIPALSEFEATFQCKPLDVGQPEGYFTLYATYDDGTESPPWIGTQVFLKVEVDHSTGSFVERSPPLAILFPNPAGGILNIENYKELESVSIVDVMGIQHLAYSDLDIGKLQFPITSLAPGIYYLVGKDKRGAVIYLPFVKR